MAHTPVPWTVTTDDERFGVYHLIGFPSAKTFGDVLEEDEANARLMSKAPDLLAACKSALAYIGSVDKDWKCFIRERNPDTDLQDIQDAQQENALRAQLQCAIRAAAP